MIEFNGYMIDVKKVSGIGPVRSYSTGSMACDWTYGFDIFLDGNTIEFKMKEPRGLGYGDVTREEFEKSTLAERTKLIGIIERSS